MGFLPEEGFIRCRVRAVYDGKIRFDEIGLLFL